YADAVRIHVGNVLYVPRGCGAQPAPLRCRDLIGDRPATAGLAMSVIADRSAIKASEASRAHLEVRNVGTHDFVIETGEPIEGSLVKPKTKHVVGTYFGFLSGTGLVVRLAPGQTETILVVFGAARCDGRRGSALPPGRYGLRVVLKPEGPA